MHLFIYYKKYLFFVYVYFYIGLYMFCTTQNGKTNQILKKQKQERILSLDILL